MRYLILILILAACEKAPPLPKCTKAQMDTEQELFLTCLDKTKSSVTQAHDDEDTDDTINECAKQAANISGIGYDWKNCIKKFN